MNSYDPEFGDWEFGKLSALREIAFALEDGYKYYYMGVFYLGSYWLDLRIFLKDILRLR